MTHALITTRTESWQNVKRHMAIPKMTNAIIEAAILGFEEQKRQIDAQIAELRAMLSGTAAAPAEAADVTPTGRQKRKVSAAGRKAMALAQQKRWAAKKAVSAPEVSEAPEAPVAAKPKRTLSAAAKAKMIAAIKKTWAAKRAAAKQSA
jgi:hypothetical protein